MPQISKQVKFIPAQLSGQSDMIEYIHFEGYKFTYIPDTNVLKYNSKRHSRIYTKKTVPEAYRNLFSNFETIYLIYFKGNFSEVTEISYFEIVHKLQLKR